MIEIHPIKKNKVNLADYDYTRDIANRLFMAQLSLRDIEVLEEIVHSSLNISLSRLIKNLNIEEREILPILHNLSKTGLLKVVNETVLVDKEMRKYYESQICKFEDDFTPGMEFLQTILKKPPIQVLPGWYSIPRGSNNIFESLVEKCLLTPQIFQRYLNEVKQGDPHLASIIDELFSSQDFRLSSAYIIEKYHLPQDQFAEYMLYLEFNFICCLGYQYEGDDIKEMITPFYEWREYLRFLRDTETPKITENVLIQRKRAKDFSFIQDLSTFLTLIKKEPMAISPYSRSEFKLEPEALKSVAVKCELKDEKEDVWVAYIYQMLSKLKRLKLVDVVDDRLYALESANDWLDMRLENRALFIHRHPLNQLMAEGLSSHFFNDRLIREAEKSIQRVLNSGWVYFDDFLKGVLVPLAEESLIMLKRTGKSWKYSLPRYTDQERLFIKSVIFEGLFEVGVVATGNVDGRDCFTVTPFGSSLFGK